MTISKHTSERRSVSRSREQGRHSGFYEYSRYESKLQIVTFNKCYSSVRPSRKVLEGLYVSKLHDSSQAQTMMALFNQEILRGGGQRDYHRLRMCVKLHLEQAQRSKNFRIESEITELVAVTEGKGQNSFTKRKTGECFQWKANGSCSKGDSCSFLHSRASGNRETSAEGAKNTGVSSLKPAVDNERRRKGKEQASSSVTTGKGQTDDKRSKSPEARPATGVKILCLCGGKM